MNRDPQLCPSCAAEQHRLYRPGAPTDERVIDSPDKAGKILLPMIGTADREQAITVSLDTRHRLVAATTSSIGTIDHTFMNPRDIFRDALQHNAATVILAHNHPSGDPSPSRDDQLLTRRIEQAGTVVGVPLLDHIVVGRDRWVSLAREGMVTGQDYRPPVAAEPPAMTSRVGRR